jgi:hypothetical protein
MPPDIPPEKETACIQYGTFAGQMVSDRNDGVPLSKEIAEIRSKPMKAEMALERYPKSVRSCLREIVHFAEGPVAVTAGEKTNGLVTSGKHACKMPSLLAL